MGIIFKITFICVSKKINKRIGFKTTEEKAIKMTQNVIDIQENRKRQINTKSVKLGSLHKKWPHNSFKNKQQASNKRFLNPQSKQFPKSQGSVVNRIRWVKKVFSEELPHKEEYLDSDFKERKF